MISYTGIPFEKVSEFSKRDKLYQNNPNTFAPFVHYMPSLASFDQAIKERQLHPVDRTLLVEVFKQQYEQVPNNQKAIVQINTLQYPKTFTITTAHQPSLFTGPLYFVYKIISTINLAASAKKKYPAFDFVPIFVVGGEDHDFEEVNYLNIFRKKITWNNESGGSVGRMSTESLKDVKNELFDIIGNGIFAEELKNIINSSFKASDSYGNGMQRFVHSLLESYGILILNMDNPALKRRFSNIMEREILHKVSSPIVQKTQKSIEKIGFKPQAYVREINLFYLLSNKRARIIEENGVYRILDTDLNFSPDEIIKELHDHPEKFSPNVVLRPLYQEYILPNLAYVGGGGELAYWMERKQQFYAFGVFYPILYRRDSVLWINKHQKKSMDQLDISLDALIKHDENSLTRTYIEKHATVELEFSNELKHVATAYAILEEKAGKIDPTLAKSIKGEEVKQLKNFHNLTGRLIRSLKQKQETEIQKIKKLKGELFPNHGLQERHDNFIPFYLRLGPVFFDTLLENLDPENSDFKVFIES